MRRGFTLVEVMIVIVLIGILSGLALPNLRNAVFKANAAKIVGDVRTIELAVRTYMVDSLAPPRSGGWGSVPASLRNYLPGGMQFSYKGLDYRLVTQLRLGTVRLLVRYARNDGTGLALQRYAGPNVDWTARRTTFWFER